jgi:hypothetical protein
VQVLVNLEKNRIGYLGAREHSTCSLFPYSPQWDVDLGRLHISQLFTSDVFRKVQWGHVHFAWTPLEELAPAFTLPEATLPGLRPQTRI